VLEHDGSLAWSRPWPGPVAGRGASLGIADFDQDGVPEVFDLATVMSADGSLAWTAPVLPWVGTLNSFSNAVDLDPGSPGLELLLGNEAFDSAGMLLWQSRAVTSRGATGVGDVDGDGEPEIAVVTAHALDLLDRLGNAIGDRMPLPTGQPAQPLIADLDADGLADVVVPARDLLAAFHWDGRSLAPWWSIPIHDPSCCAGATAFDFDGDGAAEVVHGDHDGWYVLEGRDGTLLHAEPTSSGTAFEFPVVADVDCDPHAEILVVDMTGVHSLIAYEVPGSATPRSIVNQQTYHVTNVRDDGTIPRVEEPAWRSGAGWYAQAAADPGSRHRRRPPADPLSAGWRIHLELR